MAKFSVVRYARDAIIPAVTVNVAGAVEPKLDNYLNAHVKFLSSNSTINTNAKYAKYIKALIYTSSGLAVQAITEAVADGNAIGEAAGAATGNFLYGLSGATLAEDPVMNVPGGFKLAGNPQGTLPARQVVTKTANYIS